MNEVTPNNWREDFQLVRTPDYKKYLSQSEEQRKKNLIPNAMEIFSIIDESGKRIEGEMKPYNWFFLKLGMDFMAMHGELKDSPEDQEYLTKLYIQVGYVLGNSRGKYRKAFFDDRQRQTKTKIKVKKTNQ
jgi:hypothetical protein